MSARKYRNAPTTVDGITFASKAEARRYGELKQLEKAGNIRAIQIQPKLELKVEGTKIGNYIGDFWYFDIEACEYVLEDVKGIKTPVYRLKKKLVKALHGIDIVEISYGQKRR